MNDSLIKFGIFAAGIGIGVLASRTYFDKKYQAIADEEIDSCREVFNAKIKEAKELIVEIKNAGKVISESVKDEEVPNIEKNRSYSSLYPVVDVEEREYDDFYKKDETESIHPTEDDDKYEISIEDWEDDNDFDKVTLNYYTEDGTLVYEESEELADEAKTIGIDNLSDFDMVSERTCYVRDSKNNIDYEVIKVDGSYRELIAGM